MRCTSGPRASAERIGPPMAVALLLLFGSAEVTGSPLTFNCNQPPLGAHPRDCCALPSLISPEVLQTCKQHPHVDDLKRRLVYEYGKCFVECAMNATGTLINGELHHERVLELIRGATQQDAAVAQMFQNSAIYCVSQPERHAAQPTVVSSCGSRALSFVGCVNIQNFKNCPPHHWVGSDYCNTLRAYIEQCPPQI